MKPLFEILSKLSPLGVILALILITIIIILTQFKETLLSIIKLKPKKRLKCSYCINTIIGIREKYESEVGMLEKSILKKQMVYAEVKSHEIFTESAKTFSKEVFDTSEDIPKSIKLNQISNYKEALKNAINVDAKNEVRRSFKENGFYDLSEQEFYSYAKSKANYIISIVKDYMSYHYPQNEEIIITMEHRFEKLDETALSSSIISIYENARNVVRDANEKRKELKNKFSKDIDNFSKNTGIAQP